MGNFDFTEGEKRKWIQFDSDSEVEIKLITKQELREIVKTAAKRAKLTGEDQADIADRLLGRAAVKWWRKVGQPDHPGLLANGEPLPFTLENIDRLMTKSLKFSRFINETCIDEDEFAEGVDVSKNG